MASTDIDGSKIVILSEDEAQFVVAMIETLEALGFKTDYEKALRERIERALR